MAKKIYNKDGSIELKDILIAKGPKFIFKDEFILDLNNLSFSNYLKTGYITLNFEENANPNSIIGEVQKMTYSNNELRADFRMYRDIIFGYPSFSIKALEMVGQTIRESELKTISICSDLSKENTEYFLPTQIKEIIKL